MKPIFSVAGLFAFASTFALAQASSDAENLAAAKEGLRQMFNELNEAVRTHDRAAMERIYADEFLFVHAGSGVVTRSELLKGPRPGIDSPHPSGIAMPDLDKIQLYGDVAVLRTHTLGPPEIFGTNIYIKRQGRWQILQVQGTMQPPPRKAITLDPKILASYVGKYEQAPGRIAEVSLQGEGLCVAMANGTTFTFRPLGDDQFFAPGTLAQLMFHRTDAGRIRYFTWWTAAGGVVKCTRID